MCKQLKFIVYVWMIFVTEGKKCDQPAQDKCVFIVSTGRSGSTALMHALNMMDSIFVRGENYGLFYMIESLYNAVKVLSNQKNNEEDILKLYNQYVGKNHKPSWFNAFPNNTADCVVKTIFKTMYGHGKLDTYRVGFKEIRYGPWQDTSVRQIRGGHHHHNLFKTIQKSNYTTTQDYNAFKQRMQFLLNLCKDPKIVLNMRQNSTDLLQSGFYNRKDADLAMVEAYKEWVFKFMEEFQNITFLVYYEDMFNTELNQTLANDLMTFLNVPWNSNVTFAGIRKGR